MLRPRASRPRGARTLTMAPGQGKSGHRDSQRETVVSRSLGNARDDAGDPPPDDYPRPLGAVPLEATPHVETPAEHIRNALAIISALEYVAADGQLATRELVAGFAGITKRLNAALEQLEPRGERR